MIVYRVACDECEYMSGEFRTPLDLGLYLLNEDHPDGAWLTTEAGRHICRGCVIDRACRIFGHAVVNQPAPLGGRPWCTRCHTMRGLS